MADNDNFNSVSAAFKKAMEYIHKQKKYQPEMLADKSVLALINATNDVLSKELDNLSVKQDIPEDLVSTLKKNVFFFSGFKTHHELTEASRMLQSEDGGFKPFEKFYQDVKAIDNTYNRNYLKAEYNFATASTQMAVKWKEWEKSADRYDLQYRTAGDDRVREEHEALDGITLPMTDTFWNEYLPPMGWNCRCTAVRVRKGKYPTSDSDDAIRKGKNCTSKPKQQIFRFNPGKQEKIFPPKHPYFPKGCGDCEYKLSYDKNNPNCQACLAIVKNLQKFIIDKDKKKTESIIKNKKKNIQSFNGLQIKGSNFDSGKITILRRSLSDVYEHAIEDDVIRNWIRNFEYEELKSLKFKGWAPNRKYPKNHPKFDPKNPNEIKHKNDTEYFNYYTIKIENREYWANVKVHKDYGEVLYTIEKDKPKDLIKGYKKK